MINMIKQFDFLGPAPKLKIYSKSHYMTAFGGILSILTLLALAGLCSYFTIQTFSRSSLKVLFSEGINDNPQHNVTQFPFAVTLFDTWGHPILNDNTIFNVQSMFMQYRNLTLSSQEIQITPCAEEYFPTYANYFSTLPIGGLNCINPSNNSQNLLFGNFGSLDPFSMYNIYINKCVNSSKIQCKDETYINYILEDAYIALVYLDYLIDNKNTNYPGQPYLNTLVLGASNTIYKMFDLKFRKISYETDFGFVFQDIRKEEYFTVETPFISVDNRPTGSRPGNFIFLRLSTSKIISTYTRSFLKIQDLLANIGGVIKGVLFVAVLFENFFIQKFYLKNLFEELLLINKKENPKNHTSGLNLITGVKNNHTNSIYGKNITMGEDTKE
jgi:hypothetical protein